MRLCIFIHACICLSFPSLVCTRVRGRVAVCAILRFTCTLLPRNHVHLSFTTASGSIRFRGSTLEREEVPAAIAALG